MLASLTNRLRRANVSEASSRSRDAEAAAAAFVERVRDEWQMRFEIQSTVQAHRFDLAALLRRDPEMPRPNHDEATTYMRDHMIGAFPTFRLDRSGNPHPIDDAFFARRHYELEELTGLSDAMFVGLAFRCLLKRAPDAFGYGNALRALRAGTLDRIDVLRGLSASSEGRAVGIVVGSLPWHTFWRRAMRLPVAGVMISWLRTMARLPLLDRQLRMLEARTSAWHDELEKRDALADDSRVESAGKPTMSLETSIVGLHNRLGRLQAEARLSSESMESRVAQMTRHLDELTEASRRVHLHLQRLDESIRILEQPLDVDRDAELLTLPAKDDVPPGRS